jgi:hypothetical protein
MKFTKLVCVVAMAGSAAFMLIGASSAMATFETSLCKVREIPCQAAHLYPGGTTYEAKAQNPELLTALGNIECQESVLTGTLLNELAKPLLAELTSLTFNNCKRGTEACELKKTALGHALFLRTAGYGGTVTWDNTSVLLKCAANGIHCVFGGVRVFNFTSTGGNAESEEKAGVKSEDTESKDEVKKEGESGFLCPATASWDTEYFYNEPVPIYMST